LKSFVRRWLGGEEASAVRPFLEDGQRIYCIGDIHGRLDLLRQLHGLIAGDAAGFAGQRTLVYLGDYIDRGEQSKAVIDLLLDAPLPGFEAVYLLGNHEQALLDFLRHPRSVASWLTFGGRATLHSYGVSVTREGLLDDLERLRDDLLDRLPPRHLEFYQDMKLLYQAGSYCFVHAGIRPGIPLQEQRNEDLLWIRDDFTGSAVIHDHIVVHGHSITTEVDWRPNRIGIDTGAFHTGILTCLVLEGSDKRLLQTGAVD
jgi:serine/threonine protein phosphatase 1